MCDADGSSALRSIPERFLDNLKKTPMLDLSRLQDGFQWIRTLTHLLRSSIQSTSRLIQQQNFRIPHQRPRNRNPLLLTTTQLRAPAATIRSHALRQRHHEVEDIRILSSLFDLLLGHGANAAESNILPDGSLVKCRLL